MAVIQTQRNMVAALEPLPSDSVVMTRIGTAKAFEPIGRYVAAVREAEAMADQMEAHVDVVPMGVDEFVKLKTGKTLADYLRTLPDATLEELRQLCVEACAEAVRYCEDPAVKAQAASVLVQLGVVR